MHKDAVTLRCLRTVISSGGKRYALFVGYLPAAEIGEIAEAPAFEESTTHSDISRNILNPPVKSWQRPVDPNRTAQIARFFDDSGEFMPNPVLLSQNLDMPSAVRINRARGLPDQELETFEVSIPRVAQGHPKPLWILDGQHRIGGLGKSKQRENPVPLVLLANSDGSAYSPADFARIFAQVTTSATPLAPLHNEWLTFAFDLRSYSREARDFEHHKAAMRTVALLCDTQRFDRQVDVNPYWNSIAFNDSLAKQTPTIAAGGGFGYDCAEIKELILRNYFLRPSSEAPVLEAHELASQIAASNSALRRTVTGEHTKTVFFGASGKGGHKAIQDAYLIGCFEYLRVYGPPDSWDALLRQLRFHETNWDFSQWALTGGAEGNVSRDVAIKVMRQVFSERELPVEGSTLAQFLQGDAAAIEVLASHIGKGGRKLPSDFKSFVFQGGRKLFDIGPRSHLLIRLKTTNIGKVRIINKASPMEHEFDATHLLRGVVIDKTKHEPPLNLEIELEFYGGQTDKGSLQVNWSPSEAGGE